MKKNSLILKQLVAICFIFNILLLLFMTPNNIFLEPAFAFSIDTPKLLQDKSTSKENIDEIIKNFGLQLKITAFERCFLRKPSKEDLKKIYIVPEKIKNEHLEFIYLLEKGYKDPKTNVILKFPKYSRINIYYIKYKTWLF